MKRQPDLSLLVLAFLGLALMAGWEAYARKQAQIRVQGMAEALQTRSKALHLNPESLGRLAVAAGVDEVEFKIKGGPNIQWKAPVFASWLPKGHQTIMTDLDQGAAQLTVHRHVSMHWWMVIWALALAALAYGAGRRKDGLEFERREHARALKHAAEGKEGLQDRLDQTLNTGEVLDALSLLLRTVPPDGVHEALRQTLADLGQKAGVDRVQLILRAEHSQGWDAGLAWVEGDEAWLAGVASRPAELPVASMDWLSGQLDLGEGLHLESLDQLPLEAQAERTLLQWSGIRSAFFAPLKMAGDTLGYLLLARHIKTEPVPLEDRQLALSLAGVMAELVSRVRALHKAERLAALEGLHGDLARRFLVADAQDMTTAFADTLAEVGRFTKADSALLWLFHQDGNQVRLSQSWVAKGESLSARDEPVGLFPGLIRKIKQGKGWRATKVSSLGPENGSERAEWLQRGIQDAAVQGLHSGSHLLGWIEIGAASALSDDAGAALDAVAPAISAALRRERGDAALRHSEERLKGIVDGLPDALIKVDHDGTIIDARMPKGETVNSALLLGLKLEELSRRMPGLAPDAGQSLARALGQALRTGRLQVLDISYKDAKGLRVLEVRVAPRGKEALVLVRDRSEQQRRDKEQEAQLGNLLAIFDAGTRGLVLIHENARIQAFNQALAFVATKDWVQPLKIGADLYALIPEGLREPLRGLCALALRGQEPQLEGSFDTSKGSTRLMRLQALPVFSEEGKVRSVCICIDFLDQLQEARDALRVSEERYALAARGSKDGLWDLDLKTGVLYVSGRWERMLGLEIGEGPVTLDAWKKLMHPDDQETFQSRMEAHLEGRSDHLEVELRMIHAALTEHVWVLLRGLAVRDANGSAKRMAGSQSDVNLRKLTEDSLLKDALQDPLTGLPNRALLLDRLGRCQARAKRREGYAYALLYLDTDDFKAVNQSMGPRAGDQLLKELALRLEGCLRPGDTVGRLGGDEFAILLDELVQPGDATLVADRILEACQRPVEVASRSLYPSVSIGIVLSTDGAHSPSDILRDAETAMVNAKSAGRSRWMHFEPGMLKAAAQRLDLEHGLRQAIQLGQLYVHYQPLVRLQDGQVVGFEALARWDHPERGSISPAEFIPVAEASGLIVPLGRHILTEALKQWGSWAAQGAPAGLVLSVNLSPKQLEDPELLPEVKQALLKSGVSTSSLQLELTESALMGNRQMATRTIEALRSLGIAIAIDDFGTGYSSLSYLHQFSAQVLKIDRSFISRMDGLEENEAVTSAVITLGRKLGLELVAEGIETPVQAQRLKALGCHVGQGFLFSRPVGPQAVPALWQQVFNIPTS